VIKSFFAGLGLCFAFSTCYGSALLVGIANQNTFIINNEGSEQKVAIIGQPISYCKQSDFVQWAKTNLIGKSIGVQGNQLLILINSQWFSLQELLVRNGYIYEPSLVDAQEVAAAERRGEWACAAKDAIFNLILNDRDQAKIVAAIAMNESKYKGYPWPWTINVNGKSMYFKSREDAYQEILKQMKGGASSIDIGLTQINWKYHSHYFSSPWDALQPSKNILVSQMILKNLQQKFGSWGQAIRCYHDCVNPSRGGKYLNDFSKQYAEITNF